MTTRSRPSHPVLIATLRRLDAADRHVDPTGPRARATLDAILASEPVPVPPPAQAAPASSTVRGVRRPPVGRLVLAGGAVAALAAGIVVLPSLTGGDEAFATWTAAPAGLSAQESADAAAACRENLAAGAGSDQADALAAAVPAVSERRGVWTTVLLAGTDGFSGLCITDDSADPFAAAMVGSVGVPSAYAQPGPRELLATDLGVGTIDAGDISVVAGHAGADVRGVVYRSAVHGDVTATVSQGRFALWLPGDELWDASREGVDVEVTHADGTTTTARLTLTATR